MALTISTGFVVDDAIVVIENITRYLEAGHAARLHAALKGAQEIGFTVLTMSISLVAVFIPLLLMGGIVGRLFREFAVTLSVAIVVSMVVSLTTTPMMCAHLLKAHESPRLALPRRTSASSTGSSTLYGRTLSVRAAPSVRHAAGSAGHHRAERLPVHPRAQGILPAAGQRPHDAARFMADQDTSFQAMDKILLQMVKIVAADPAVDTVNGFTGGGGGGGAPPTPARMFISLKPLAERKITVDHIIARLRPKLARIPGATLYLQASQDLRVGGRNSAAQYQFTMRGDNLKDLIAYAPAHAAAVAEPFPLIADVNSDQQNRGLQSMVHLRPRHRRALRHLAAADRQHALRRLRPAPGIDHVHAAEPVSRGDGGRAASTGRTRRPCAISTCARPTGSRFR